MKTRFGAALLLLATWSSSAFADDATESARAHFADGVAKFEAGDYEAACSLFRRADSEHHAPVIVYNIARSEERLDHPQAAVDHYDAYLQEAGETGEFATAAALATAQIRARSPRVRIETTPPGAHIFVDAVEAPDRSPTTMLVTIGHHHVAAEGDAWHAEADVDATDPSKTITIAFTRPDAPKPISTTPGGPTHLAPSAESVPISGPNGLVLGANFSIVAYHFFSTRSHPDDTTTGVAPALIGDIGYAITPRVEIFLRVLGGIGSEGTPVTLVEGVGPVISFRAAPRLWLSAACLGGRIESSETPSDGVRRYFETGWVFAPMAEISLAVFQTEYGQWMLSVAPSYYFASPQDNGAFYVPIGFGLRTF